MISAGLALALAISIVPGAGRATYAPPVCRPHAVMETDHKMYNVVNSVFGTGDVQCLSVPADGAPAFRVTRSTADVGAPVQASPFIISGCFYTRCTRDSGYPVWLPRIRSLRVTWETRVHPVRGSLWDAGLDLWLNKTHGYAGHADGAEVMIWPDADLSPRASHLVRVDGREWHLWDYVTCHHTCWPLVIFRAARPVTGFRDLSLPAFFRATSRDTPFYVGHYFLEATIACFEIWRGGAGLATTLFSSALTRNN